MRKDFTSARDPRPSIANNNVVCETHLLQDESSLLSGTVYASMLSTINSAALSLWAGVSPLVFTASSIFAVSRVCTRRPGYYVLIDASKVTTPPYYNTSVHPWALKLGGRLLLHPWAVPVASYRALGPSGAPK